MICNKSSLITKSERQEGGKLQRILQIEEDSYADITGNSQNGFKRKRSTCTAGSVLWVCLPSTEKKAAVDVNHRPLPFSTGRRPTSYSFLLVDVDRTFIGQNCTFHDLLYNKKCAVNIDHCTFLWPASTILLFSIWSMVDAHRCSST